MVNLYNGIKEIVDSGVTDGKGIQRELLSRFNKKTSLNSIYTTKSFIKRARQMDNNDVSLQHSNVDKSNSVDIVRQSKQENQTMETEKIKQETIPMLSAPTEKQAPTVPQITENRSSADSNLNKSAVGQVITGQKFTLTGAKAETQLESSGMASTYQNEYSKLTDEKKKQIYIKGERIGESSGESLSLLYETKQMKKLTRGYSLGDDERKMINDDVSEILKNRLPTGIDSEYGDLINLGISSFLIFGKSVFHRFNNKELGKELIKKAETAEKEVVQQFTNINSPKKDSLLCNNCGKFPIKEDGLCESCFFTQLMQSANNEVQN